MKRTSRALYARRLLIFWTLFIGIGAVAGATAMLVDPSGRLCAMDAMLPYFKALPFAEILFCNFKFSGVMLLIVNGLTNLFAAGALLAKKDYGIIFGGIFGITLMLWICIQFYMFPFNFMSTAYFIFGLAQAITGYAAYVFGKQEKFTFDASEYKNIGTSGNKAVVYFSRMGYVKKIAYEAANTTGADIYEITSTEKIAGTLGFLWCGRFGMHRWDMPIQSIPSELAKYDEITVCSPIWVFSLAAPTRSFLRQANGKIKAVSYIFVHHTKGTYENAAEEADKLLGIKHLTLTNVCCRMGVFKKI